MTRIRSRTAATSSFGFVVMIAQLLTTSPLARSVHASEKQAPQQRPQDHRDPEPAQPSARGDGLAVAVLVESSLMLVPGQSFKAWGLEVLGVGLVVWLALGAVQRDVFRKLEPRHRTLFSIIIALGQLAVLAFVIAGVVILLRAAMASISPYPA